MFPLNVAIYWFLVDLIKFQIDQDPWRKQLFNISNVNILNHCNKQAENSPRAACQQTQVMEIPLLALTDSAAP